MKASEDACLALAGVNGFMAVAAGAFGAHGVADAQVKTLLQTGAQYQAVHAVATLACLALLGRLSASGRWSVWLFSVGALVFGGSLYLLALTGVRGFGAVTPLSGLALLGGWGALVWAAIAGRAKGLSKGGST